MIKKYLDANIFLNAILYNDKNAKRCEKILIKLVNKEIIGMTSVLTWDEVVYVIRKNLGKEIAIKESKKFLKFPNLIFVDANKRIIFYAQKLMEKYNLMPRDAIHSASAILSECEEIISEDKDFDIINGLKRVEI